ncbi:hypothetical protein M0208_13180 [Sphingomonas sp. SUN019]|uniref:hypothetical protein n=1 Tax=Sphingomonas sp. SUN019 TaxID=2937788 RepID=UPI002164BD80|nr:hypothetical protein [Sphingomonas sp. SUN019]UVO51409.1 hypothetical protein M0208_13180 [Sphingomonas sp. SUN019]
MIEDGIITARAELTRRIAAIEWRAGPATVANEIDAIRRVAHRNGMLPAVTVAHLLESALARGEQGVLVHGWLAMLKDAVGCDRQDAAASDAFAAACQVRFAA